MADNNTLDFDEIKSLVTKDDQSVTLNPLSFKLLHSLAQTPHQVVSNNSLITSVWPNSTVSPDTLKQRVFVLRKSLEQSSIKGLSIQAVRGEGYRLLIEESTKSTEQNTSTKQIKSITTNKTTSLNINLFTLSIVTLLIVISVLIYIFQPLKHDKATSNNRLALWSNIPINEMPERSLSIYQTWSDLLSKASNEQRLQLILSKQRQDLTLPIQARKDRVALISYFEVIETNKEITIKLSIIEPTTATILRTDKFLISTDVSLIDTLQSQLNGIESLMSSGKLYLNKQQREYAKDPIWQALKALANPS